MPKPNISLNAVHTFETCARLQNFRLAAEELHITASAVSYQMKSLQQKLDVSLFRHVGRNVVLTEAGSLLYAEVGKGIASIERGIEQVRRYRRADVLKLQAYMSISARWLMRRMAGFRKRFPDLPVELFTSTLGWEFHPGDADVGLIYCDKRESGLHYVPLYKDRLVAVLSPALSQGEGLPRTPADLLHYPLISTQDGNQNLQRWFVAAGIAPERLGVPNPIDTHFVALEAAIAGEGVVVMQSLFVAEDLRNGNLVSPIEHFVEDPGYWYLVCEKWRKDDPRIARLADWIKFELEK